MIKKPILTIVAISIGLFLSTAAQATLNGGIPTKPTKETHKRKEPKEKPTKKEDKKNQLINQVLILLTLLHQHLSMVISTMINL